MTSHDPRVVALLQKIAGIRGPGVVLYRQSDNRAMDWEWLVEQGYLTRSAYYSDTDEGEDREAAEERDQSGPYWVDRVQGEPLTEAQLKRLYFSFVTTEKLDELRPTPYDDCTAMDEIARLMQTFRDEQKQTASYSVGLRLSAELVQKIQTVVAKTGRPLL